MKLYGMMLFGFGVGVCGWGVGWSCLVLGGILDIHGVGDKVFVRDLGVGLVVIMVWNSHSISMIDMALLSGEEWNFGLSLNLS